MVQEMWEGRISAVVVYRVVFRRIGSEPYGLGFLFFVLETCSILEASL